MASPKAEPTLLRRHELWRRVHEPGRIGWRELACGEAHLSSLASLVMKARSQPPAR
jgi:hypothetical protein